MKFKIFSIFLALIVIFACKKDVTTFSGVTDSYKPQAAGLTIRDYQYILIDPQIDPAVVRFVNCIVVKVPGNDIQPSSKWRCNSSEYHRRCTFLCKAYEYAIPRYKSEYGSNTNILI